MRTLPCLAAALACLLGACASRGPIEHLPPRAGPLSALEMAIEIPAAERAQFALGDNRAGYFETRTHGYRGGAGYRIGEASLLANRASFLNGRRLRREQDASAEQLLPWGIDSHYAGAREQLLLHSGRAALSLAMESDAPAILAIAPLWGESLAHYALEAHGEAWLLRAPGPRTDGHPAHIALRASVPVRLLEEDIEDADALAPIAAPRLRFESTAPVTRLELHLAFEDSPEAALAAVDEIASDEAWRAQPRLRMQRLGHSWLRTGDADYDRALAWARSSALDFVVDQYGPGIWAGLPWFRDNWGRDTFIALPGTLLVAGLFEEARTVLDGFAERQQLDPDSPDYGRVPNRVASNRPTIYNTVDGTPWLLRAGMEYVRYSGDLEFADRLLTLAARYFEGAARHLDDEGLLRHADADTWMDARVYEYGPAWSPRGDRAVEIQALWITALESAAELAEARGQAEQAAPWRAQAERAREAVRRHYVQADGRVADRLRTDGSADLARRPNALMLLSVPWTPVLSSAESAALLRDSAEHLLMPYGLLSLERAHPDFHPFHENPGLHHKDASYHNGTVWGWNAGFAVSALSAHGQQDLAWRLARELGRQILALDAVGSMSELLDAAPDAQGQPRISGTWAQSWSVAEFARNAFQDFIGFRPDLLRGELGFVPAPPSAWRSVQARLAYGRDEAIELSLQQRDDGWRWRFEGLAGAPRPLRMDLHGEDGQRWRLRFALGAEVRELHWDGRRARLDGRPIALEPLPALDASMLSPLDFAKPPTREAAAYPMLTGADVLRRRLLGGGDLPRVPQGHIERLRALAGPKATDLPARDVDVWLPPGYPAQAPYAVVYMHDGQMLFDASSIWNRQSWEVAETAANLQVRGETRPFIVVGVHNGGAHRHREYFPQRVFEALPAQRQARLLGAERSSGQPLFAGPPAADAYVRFLVEELKPRIEHVYAVSRAPADSVLVGASMGGLISLYALLEQPAQFGGAAVLSTHWPGGFELDDPFIPDTIGSYLGQALPALDAQRIWMDHGSETLDAAYPPLQARIDRVFAASRLPSAQWRSRSYPGSDHSERAWAARLADPLRFLLGPDEGEQARAGPEAGAGP